MALLTQSKTTGAKTTGTRSRWLLLLFGCAGGCALINVLSPSTPTFGFSHAVHAEEGLECDNCHIYWETSDSPGIPTKGACDLCHEDIDAEQPDAYEIAPDHPHGAEDRRQQRH